MGELIQLRSRQLIISENAIAEFVYGRKGSRLCPLCRLRNREEKQNLCKVCLKKRGKRYSELVDGAKAVFTERKRITIEDSVYGVLRTSEVINLNIEKIKKKIIVDIPDIYLLPRRVVSQAIKAGIKMYYAELAEEIATEQISRFPLFFDPEHEARLLHQEFPQVPYKFLLEAAENQLQDNYYRIDKETEERLGLGDASEDY
jgi:hypothetical protein